MREEPDSLPELPEALQEEGWFVPEGFPPLQLPSAELAEVFATQIGTYCSPDEWFEWLRKQPGVGPTSQYRPKDTVFAVGDALCTIHNRGTHPNSPQNFNQFTLFFNIIDFLNRIGMKVPDSFPTDIPAFYRKFQEREKPVETLLAMTGKKLESVVPPSLWRSIVDSVWATPHDAAQREIKEKERERRNADLIGALRIQERDQNLRLLYQELGTFLAEHEDTILERATRFGNMRERVVEQSQEWVEVPRIRTLYDAEADLTHDIQVYIGEDIVTLKQSNRSVRLVLEGTPRWSTELHLGETVECTMPKTWAGLSITFSHKGCFIERTTESAPTLSMQRGDVLPNNEMERHA